MLRFSIIFLVSCFLFLSCESKQAAIGSGFKERSEADLVRAVTKHNVSFDWCTVSIGYNIGAS